MGFDRLVFFKGILVDKDKEMLARLIIGMCGAYAKGENAMALVRNYLLEGDNDLTSTLLVYDLEAGIDADNAKRNQEYLDSLYMHLAGLIKPYLTDGCDILEFGVGEATC